MAADCFGLLLLEALGLLKLNEAGVTEQVGDPASDLAFLDAAVRVDDLSHRLAAHDASLVDQALAVVGRRGQCQVHEVRGAVGLRGRRRGPKNGRRRGRGEGRGGHGGGGRDGRAGARVGPDTQDGLGRREERRRGVDLDEVCLDLGGRCQKGALYTTSDTTHAVDDAPATTTKHLTALDPALPCPERALEETIRHDRNPEVWL